MDRGHRRRGIRGSGDGGRIDRRIAETERTPVSKREPSFISRSGEDHSDERRLEPADVFVGLGHHEFVPGFDHERRSRVGYDGVVPFGGDDGTPGPVADVRAGERFADGTRGRRPNELELCRRRLRTDPL